MDGAVRLLASTATALAFVALAAGSARAQEQATVPLAEVARQAEAAKATVKKATKTYTNSDLSSDPRGEPAPAPAPASGFVSKSLGKPVPAAELVTRSEAQVESEAVAKESEEAWRKRADSVRRQVVQLRERLTELMTSDASTAESPAVRVANASDIATTRAALESVRKQWARLETSAKELKVPIAWLEPLPTFPQ